MQVPGTGAERIGHRAPRAPSLQDAAHRAVGAARREPRTLCGVELISPKEACARTRRSAGGALRVQPGEDVDPQFDVLALQRRTVRAIVVG